MSKLEKLIQRIKNNPKTVRFEELDKRFEELDKLLRHEGYVPSQPRRGSSHYTYRKPGRNLLTIPRKIPYVNECYVVEVLAELGL